MSNLEDLQRRFAAAVMTPLTRDERMRRKNHDVAEAIVAPNSRLTSFERLEIYNRQYWFRVLGALAEDFPGLRTIVGQRSFEALSRAYLDDCPSVSFTLRNLGSRLPAWLNEHPEYLGERRQIASDMVRLEWAHIESFDSLAKPQIAPEQLESGVALQPYVQLVQASYAVDDLLIEIRNADDQLQARRRVRRFEQAPEQACIAVHRLSDSVYYKRLQPEAFGILSALGEGKDLEQALEAGFMGSQMPEVERMSCLQQWFANWAELGWLCEP